MNKIFLGLVLTAVVLIAGCITEDDDYIRRELKQDETVTIYSSNANIGSKQKCDAIFIPESMLQECYRNYFCYNAGGEIGERWDTCIFRTGRNEYKLCQFTEIQSYEYGWVGECPYDYS